MIDPIEVKKFIKAPRDSHAWMKKLTHRDVKPELERLGFKPANTEEPFTLHQKVCFLLGVAYPAFAFWLDMGTGKTRLVLELLRYWRKHKRLRVALVLAPSESALISWEDQIKTWKVNIPFITIAGSSSAQKWSDLEGFDDGLILATYAGLTRMLCSLQKVKNKAKRKLQPDKKLVKKFRAMIQALVLDEATNIANRGSLATRLCMQLGKGVDIRYEMAGRPFGRDPTNLWTQCYLVDRGETLGTTLGMFREAFFMEKPNYWGGTEFIFRRSMEPVLKRILQHRSITYAAEECIDLPKLVPTIEQVELPQEASAYYQRFVEQIRARNATFIERNNSFIRMRQVSSGFVGFSDDETGEKAEISFATNPKLDRLAELVEEVPRGCKFVIFHEFTNSGRIICNRLKDLGIKHEWLWGGNKNVRQSQQRFDDDEKVRGLVVNAMLGAFALNLQRANYLFYFESPVPVIRREQSERRVRRQGQQRTVFQCDLICKGTVDARILAFHRQGGDLFKAIIRDPDKALGKGPRGAGKALKQA